ncbi:hypothetical protein KCU85_g6189, partial [Aureobasidium melanogenum]
LLDKILALLLSFFYLLYVVLRLEIKITASPLLPAEMDNYLAAHEVDRRRYSSFSELNLLNSHLQPDSAVAVQKTVNLPCDQDENIISDSSDSIHRSAISSGHPSPCTPYSEVQNAAAYAYCPDPPLNIGGDRLSPDLWTMSPEERSLMTNSANFARGRRRRGAIQHEASLELDVSSSHSPAPPPPFFLSPDLDSSDDDKVRVSEDLSGYKDNTATPRGRLQRSFTPSEREDAGVVLVPGLLRRLSRPFSGPWRGPSSPLTPVSSVAAPPVGRLARLRRLFSRRR